MKKLKYFTDPWYIFRIPIALFAQFFERFAYPQFPLPVPKPDNDSYHISLAQKMECLGAIPEALLQALYEVEELTDSLIPLQPASGEFERIGLGIGFQDASAFNGVVESRNAQVEAFGFGAADQVVVDGGEEGEAADGIGQRLRVDG